jgi:deoxyribose-phosphate aldolase
MEQKMAKNTISTKANPTAQTPDQLPVVANSVLLSKTEADEYRSYKRQKYLDVITAAMSKSQGSLLTGEDVQKVCERATRLCQQAVELPLSKFSQTAFYLGKNKVKLDCVVGGTGETHVKVKVYETRLALKNGAKEITLMLTPSLVDACRYGEIRREIKRVRRAAKRACLKVRIEKNYSPTIVSRLARICSDTGTKFFSVPDFSECEKLRMDLTRGCKLEVFGVQTLKRYRDLVGAGVERIVTNRAMDFYTAWLKECNDSLFTPCIETEKNQTSVCDPQKDTKVETDKKTTFNAENPQDFTPIPAVTSSSPLSCPPVNGKEETDYRCKLDGAQLKFL